MQVHRLRSLGLRSHRQLGHPAATNGEKTVRIPRDRFYNYREITARFDSTSNACGAKVGGHEVKKGDRIGYNRSCRPAKVMCTACWDRWVAENQEADAIESGYMPQCW